jgi:hypothetical protein
MSDPKKTIAEKQKKELPKVIFIVPKEKPKI